MSDHLSPLARRVLTLSDAGVGLAEMSRRFKRSPAHLERVLEWTEIPRIGPPPRTANRAMERRVLRLRADGETHQEIAERFRRSPDFMRRVEGFAHYRRAMDILG
ncbi:MAG TPA: hypothetical protein VMM81_04530 [Acidimicrobiia bacterium]|nr:hypothetical protein [Acidimicrobiia bacterium]